MRLNQIMPAVVIAMLSSMPKAVLADVVSSASVPLPHDKIDAIDVQFRQLYVAARKDFLKDGGPILMWRQGGLTLMNGDQSTRYDYMPQSFDSFKVLDHITLGIFVAVVHDPEHASAERLAQLAAFRQAILDARPQIENSYQSRTLQRQQRIMDKSLAFIDLIQSKKGCSRSELKNYIFEVLPAVNANVKDAVSADLGAMEPVVKKIKDSLSAEDWTKLHVIVCGVHMARANEAHMQYFLRLLKEPQEGHRVVFFEGQGEEKDAVDLLGTHELDTQIGEGYFGDPDRMHRDLLSVSAGDYLDNHPPLSQ